ncbi:MAG: molybdopterin-synthase adenylyltransferase MoeB [Steroidobacteraceae bacterium]|nr:molybdopterin-synthase adenylyltransferase MoeB [Steroidobacteraceae bacterium]
MTLSAAERERYQRHLTLEEIGPAGQQKLRAARVLVVGVGGLGSPAALYLAASGVGTLGLVDCDRVDASNLQRQVLFDSASVGRPKVEVARERLLGLNPHIDVRSHALELRADNVMDVVREYDVVLDGTDRIPTRYIVNDACVLLGKPLVSAAIHRFEGQVMTCLPGRGPCYRCLYAEVPDGLVPNCADAGVLGVLPGVVGTIQATEAIKLIVGAGDLLSGRLLVYDALDMAFREFRVERRRDCAVCGDRPTITAPIDPPGAACAAPATGDRIGRLRPVELQQLLRAARSPPLLVDVREPREFVAGHIAGSVNLPLPELAARLREIPVDAAPVFICRSGARSANACAIAVRAGVHAAFNLDGGLLAWAAEIDPTLVVASAR